MIQALAGRRPTTERWWMCERKRPYSRRGAYRAAARATERTGKQHRTYRCPFCEAFHITHQAKGRT